MNAEERFDPSAPWEAYEWPDMAWVVIVPEHHDNGYALDIRFDFENDYGMTREDCKRLAHLIAAAPRLLTALEELVGVVEGLYHESGFISADLPLARAAIAKAKGESR